MWAWWGCFGSYNILVARKSPRLAVRRPEFNPNFAVQLKARLCPLSRPQFPSPPLAPTHRKISG